MVFFQHGHKIEGVPRNASVFQIFEAIVRKSGVRGLFKGMESKIIQTVMTAALMFTLYEKIAAFVFRLMKVRRAMKA